VGLCDNDVGIVVRSSADNTDEHVSSSSELSLNDVSLSDSGTYLCTASNSQGSATARVTVTVTGHPHILSLTVTVFSLISGYLLGSRLGVLET